MCNSSSSHEKGSERFKWIYIIQHISCSNESFFNRWRVPIWYLNDIVSCGSIKRRSKLCIPTCEHKLHLCFNNRLVLFRRTIRTYESNRHIYNNIRSIFGGKVNKITKFLEKNDDFHHFIRILWVLELYMFLAFIMAWLPSWLM